MSNYTSDQTAYIVAEYENSDDKTETLDRLSQELGKSKKSIVGKLSREGVYKRVSYVTKSGVAPITKVELVKNIGANLELEEHQLEGLEKAPKQVLILLESTTVKEERSVENWRKGTLWERSIDPS